MSVTNIFTFNRDHWPNENRYVAITGKSRADCRLQMVRRFGTAWSYQYDDMESAGVERYRLTEIPAPTPPSPPPSVYTTRVNGKAHADSVVVDPWNSTATPTTKSSQQS